MDPLTRLQAGIDQARPIVAAVGEGDYGKSTPFSVPEMRGSDFEPPVPVPDDADQLSRLVALLGRQP